MLALGAGARAGVWYGLFETGATTHAFETTHIFSNGQPSVTYDESARGTVVSAAVGCRFIEKGKFGLAAQGGLSYDNGEWNLEEIDSTHVKNAPWTISAELVPSMSITGRCSVFALLGFGGTHITSIRTPVPPGSGRSYSFDGWRPAFVTGAGVRVDVSENAGISMQYRRISYQEFAFDEYGAGGEQIGNTQEALHTDTLTLGLWLTFK